MSGFVRALAALLLSAGAWSSAFAECGGSRQCIGTGATPTNAATAGVGHHTAPDVGTPTFTLGFGNQVIGTTSASQTIHVAAVTGPAGQMATLGAITLSGANAADFTITGGTCSPANGPVHGGAQCTITVAFRPATLGAKSALVNVPLNPPPGCGGCISGRSVAVTGTGAPVSPAANAASLSVQADLPATLDLQPLVSGTALLGVRLLSSPTQGTASLSGTVVTYTPNRGYIGADSFTFQSFSATENSAPATVSVSVVARRDPTQDARVTSLLNAQAQTARRFSQAQRQNFQSRLESLHRGPGPSQPAGGGSGLRADPAPMVASAAPATDSGDPMAAAWLGSLAEVATSGTLNLNHAFGARGGSARQDGAVTLWVAGQLNIGRRDPSGGTSGLRFTTEGISIGADRRFGERLALGLGLGYAQGRAHEESGTDSRSRGTSVTAYGSYQPTPDTFIDAVLGYGRLSFDTARFDSTASALARSDRRGRQWFGSMAAGFERRGRGFLFSPYGRLDFANDRLGESIETGAGANSLRYLQQDLDTLQLALGVRAESQHAMRFGWVVPRVRLEVRHDLRQEGQARLAYADQAGGPVFTLASASTKRDTLALGLGSELYFRAGFRAGADYQVQGLTGQDRVHGLRLWLAADLDGARRPPPGLTGAGGAVSPNPVNVEASYTFDTNVTRARDAADRYSDHVLALNAGKSFAWTLGTNSRALLTAFAEADKHRTYGALDRLSGGAQGELQYRTSASFGAPTLGVFARATLDEYDSRLRSGQTLSLGATYRQWLTDRISLFGRLSANARSARSAVFSGHHTAGHATLDYSLGRGSLYLGGELRRGDAVSSGGVSPESLAIAKASVLDDAFAQPPLTAYRHEAQTVIFSLGYNFPLGARDSIDLSWRHIESSPTARGTFNVPPGPYGGGGPLAVGKSRYTADQLSAAYLIRF